MELLNIIKIKSNNNKNAEITTILTNKTWEEEEEKINCETPFSIIFLDLNQNPYKIKKIVSIKNWSYVLIGVSKFEIWLCNKKGVSIT